MNKLDNKWPLVEYELSQVESGLKQIVDTSGPEIKTVGDYIFNGRGKRIRPALFLIAAYKPGFNLEPLLEAAVAFELVHTASLLHDDVIDQATQRRGKDTVNVRWNNKISILAGDYFLSRAFQLFVNYNNWQLISILVDVVRNMAEGEVEQAFAAVESEDLEERYFRWIGKKSAALFAGCCRAGSLLGGDSDLVQSAWQEYGYNLGIAFQLIDDLLDYTGEGGVTGKPRYGDLNNSVITLPLIKALSDGSLGRGLNYNNGSIKQVTASVEETSDLAEAIMAGNGLSYTLKKAEEYVEKASIAVGKLTAAGDEKKLVLKQVGADILMRQK